MAPAERPARAGVNDASTRPLSASVSAIGLYSYDGVKPTADLFARFHEIVLRTFAEAGIELTYFGADPGFGEKLRPVRGRTYGKLLDSRFETITELSLVANPRGSDSPAFDHFAFASLAYLEATQELLGYVTANESFISFGSQAYDQLFAALVDLKRWSFGFGFAAAREMDPDLYILGCNNGKLSKAQERLLNVWYACEAETRSNLLRDLYPYNLLNERQLEHRLAGGLSLLEFAQREPGTTLNRAPTGLAIWRIPKESVEQIKRRLEGSSVFIGAH
jgi:hypothetical protein